MSLKLHSHNLGFHRLFSHTKEQTSVNYWGGAEATQSPTSDGPVWCPNDDNGSSYIQQRIERLAKDLLCNEASNQLNHRC